MWKYCGFVFLCFLVTLPGASQVHTSYLWHLEQPVYWPETSTWNSYEHQAAWESQYLKWNNGNWYNDGLQHPLNNIQEIFGSDDRKAVLAHSPARYSRVMVTVRLKARASEVVLAYSGWSGPTPSWRIRSPVASPPAAASSW